MFLAINFIDIDDQSQDNVQHDIFFIHKISLCFCIYILSLANNVVYRKGHLQVTLSVNNILSQRDISVNKLFIQRNISVNIGFYKTNISVNIIFRKYIYICQYNFYKQIALSKSYQAIYRKGQKQNGCSLKYLSELKPHILSFFLQKHPLLS